MEQHPSKQLSSEKMIALAKITPVVKDEENPMPCNNDKLLNGITKPLCTDGPSTKILNVGKKENVLVPVSLPPGKLIPIPLTGEDSSKRGKTSPVSENLPAEFEGNSMYGDNLPPNGDRKPLPTSDCSMKVLDMDKNECVPVPVLSPPIKPVPNPLSRGNYSRTGENSKVKFISAEEAALLTSGAKAKPCPARGSLGTVPYVAKRTSSSVPATEASKPCLLKENSNSICGAPPGFNKHVPYRSIERGTSLQSPSVKTPQESHFERPPSCLSKPFTSERLRGIDEKLFIPRSSAIKSVPRSFKVWSQPDGSSVDREAYVSPSKRAKRAELKHNGEAACNISNNEDLMLTMNNASGKAAASAASELSICKKEQQANAVGASSTDGQLKNSDVKETVLPMIMSGFSKGEFEGADAVWKGSFEICDAFFHTDFFEEIEAHRPIIISHKVCEVSKQMPKKLLFKLMPRLDIWPPIFLKGCPTVNDIALYFLPREVNSSRKKYVDLLELIEMDDLAMQCYLGGLELLMFTSKQLPVNSQRLNLQFYLWGVFRRVKDTEATYLNGGLSSIPAPGTGNLQEDHGIRLEDGGCNKLNFTLVGNAEEVDMEIDMLGGKNVGRIDKPVPRPVAFKSAEKVDKEIDMIGGKDVGEIDKPVLRSIAFKSRKSSELTMRSNGQKVSSPHSVSSNSSSLRHKRVRFSNDTSTPNPGRKTTNTQVLDGTPNVLSGTKKEKEIERSTVSMSTSALTRSTTSGSQHLIRQYQHGPYDGTIRPLSSTKANRLELTDYPISYVPPGFCELSTTVDSQEKSVLKSLNKPTIQKVMDVPAHFGKPIISEHEFCSSVAANIKEKAIAGDTNLQTPSNIARDMDISPGFMKQLDSEDKCRSSEVICRKEKDEYQSFDTTNKKGEDEHRSSEAMVKRKKDEYHSSEATSGMGASPGFIKQLDRKNGSLKASCRKEKDECRSSEAKSKILEGECHPFVAMFKRKKDEYNSSESIDRNKKAIRESAGVGNHFKDAGVECGSSKGRGLHLQAHKSITNAGSPQVHQVSHHGFEAHLPTDSIAHSMAASPTNLGSDFPSGGTSCLQLFPLEAESETQEIEKARTDNDLVMVTAQCAKGSCPMNGVESLVLSLSRPDYLNDGNNWITVLSKERLQQDGCGSELRLTL